MRSLLASLALFVPLALFAPIAEAVTILTPTDSRVVSDLTTTTNLGTPLPDAGACCNGTAVPIRSRADTSQDNIQVVTFLQFDVSSFSVGDVNNAGFSAQFRIDLSAKLNTTANALEALVGRNQGGAWNSSGSLNPLHDWGFVDESSTVAAADSQTLVANIAATSPPVPDITVDVSTVVKDWVEGTNPNWGFVVFYGQNSFQGAGFDDPELLITIPEPGSFALLLTGIATLGLRRRRR